MKINKTLLIFGFIAIIANIGLIGETITITWNGGVVIRVESMPAGYKKGPYMPFINLIMNPKTTSRPFKIVRDKAGKFLLRFTISGKTKIFDKTFDKNVKENIVLDDALVREMEA